LIPCGKAINARARRRLLALQEFNQLGSGFQLALRDLEIRGMGNLLGRQQHGHIAAIGFQLYNDMLAHAVKKIRQAEEEPEIVTALDMTGRGGIDPEYVPSARIRMSLHKRLAQTKTLEEVDGIEGEMKDMFGVVPERAQRFLESVRLRTRATCAGFEKVAIGKDVAQLVYSPLYVNRRFAPEKIIAYNNRWGLTFQVRVKDDTIALEIQDVIGKDDFIERLGKFLDKLSEI
jgi:transcription-repair coupling factor (superfamily II helicase)